MMSILSKFGNWFLRNSRDMFVLFIVNIILWVIIILSLNFYSEGYLIDRAIFFGLVLSIAFIFFACAIVGLILLLLRFINVSTDRKIENYLIIVVQYTVILLPVVEGLENLIPHNDTIDQQENIKNANILIFSMVAVSIIFWLLIEIFRSKLKLNNNKQEGV